MNYHVNFRWNCHGPYWTFVALHKQGSVTTRRRNHGRVTTRRRKQGRVTTRRRKHWRVTIRRR